MQDKNIKTPLYIEFIGPPGAGKTHYLKELTNLLKAEGFTVKSNIIDFFIKFDRYNRPKRYIYSLLHLFTSFKTIKRLIILIFKLDIFNAITKTRHYVFLIKYFLGRSFYLRKLDFDIFIEEIVGETSALVEISKNKEDLKFLLNFFWSDNIIVIDFCISPKIAIKRISKDPNRDRKTIDKFIEGEVYEFYKNMEKNKNQVMHILKNFNNVSILKIDSAKSIKYNISHILEVIKNTSIITPE